MDQRTEVGIDVNIKDKSSEHSIAYHEASRWTSTIITELEKNKWFDKWTLASDQQYLLALFLAGTISRKRGGEIKDKLHNFSLLPNSKLNELAVKMHQKQLDAQNEVAQSFFDQAKKTQQLSTQSFTYNTDTEIITPTSPVDETRMEYADDLSRLANLLSSTMMTKLQKGFIGYKLPKDSGWIASVAENFKFTYK